MDAEKIDRNFELAAAIADADLHRLEREAWEKLIQVDPESVRQIKEARFIREKLFNEAARRQHPFRGCLRDDPPTGIKIS